MLVSLFLFEKKLYREKNVLWVTLPGQNVFLCFLIKSKQISISPK